MVSSSKASIIPSLLPPLLFIAVGLITYQLSYNACDNPIPYTLGSVDPKFEITTSRANEDIQKAATIWNSAYTKPLFVYSPNADLKINFTYDERTALNAQINSQQNLLDQKNETLKQQMDAYDADVAVLEAKLADFNKRVNEINKAGGASEDQYNTLVAEQKSLNQQGEMLNARATELNVGARTFNANLKNLKDDMNQFNRELLQKPEEGLYNPRENSITVYFAQNRDELVHTLAHELGHALAMDHTQDLKDIMYPSSTRTLSLSPNDSTQLAYICRKQSLLVHVMQEMRIKILLLLQQLSSETSHPSPASQ